MDGCGMAGVVAPLPDRSGPALEGSERLRRRARQAASAGSQAVSDIAKVGTVFLALGAVSCAMFWCAPKGSKLETWAGVFMMANAYGLVVSAITGMF
jgi:hypothetical protein